MSIYDYLEDVTYISTDNTEYLLKGHCISAKTLYLTHSDGAFNHPLAGFLSELSINPKELILYNDLKKKYSEYFV